MDTDKIILEQFLTRHPLEAALAVETLSDDDIIAFMEELPIMLNINLISQMKAYRGASCLQQLPPGLAKELIDQLDLATAESLLWQCEEPFRGRLLDSAEPKRAAALREKLEYERDTVGAWMMPSVFALPKEILVKDAIDMVRREKDRIFSAIYVINKEDKLLGHISLKELFFADQTNQLAAIMNTEGPKLLANSTLKSIRHHPGWNEHLFLPVVDKSGKLIGLLDFATCQKSNVESSRELGKEILETSGALGELYFIGLTGFIQSFSK